MLSLQLFCSRGKVSWIDRGHFAISFYTGAGWWFFFFSLKRTKCLASVTVLPLPPGDNLFCCREYLCLKPGVSVVFDQSFHCKSWAAPPCLIMNLSWNRLPTGRPGPCRLRRLLLSEGSCKTCWKCSSLVPFVWGPKHLLELEKARLNSVAFFVILDNVNS